MNKNQWFVLGMGLLFLGSLMFFYVNLNCSVGVFGLDESLMTCRYSYSRPAIISGVLGFLFLICSWLEPKKKV